MDIKVEEYVRINNDFRLTALGIGKVIKISKDAIYVKMNFELPISLKIENIAKHNKNIIDLIEIGDFANGFRVIDTNILEGYIIIQNINKYEENGIKVLLEEDIETILTKEQYNQNCYKLNTK